MGKPYAAELRCLEGTYNWAVDTPVDELASALAASSQYPLLAVGSGGSLTAAFIAAYLHQQHSGRVGKAMTPLECVSTLGQLRRVAVLLISAGGRNPDVIGALRRIVGAEPCRFAVLCLEAGSSLVKIASRYRSIELATYETPSGKDGFLATNSLLAQVILVTRAYANGYSIELGLPPFIELIGGSPRKVDALRELSNPLWSRPNLIVLHGIATQAAAVDLESKFAEAALGTVQPADYRNFAHGRHNWLAKRADETAVLAFVTEDDVAVSNETIRLIPSNVPVVQIQVPGDRVIAAISALVATIHIVGLAGEAKGIDPGRPGVPPFGRKIYNFNAFRGRGDDDLLKAATIAIKRKICLNNLGLLKSEERDLWMHAYRRFSEALLAARFQAVLCDYDGTLCDERDRFIGLSQGLASQLVRLLGAGILVGVATGRGKSVKKALRASLPRQSWSRVMIAYYNGAEVGFLDDDTKPDGTDQVCSDLLSLADALRKDLLISESSECSFRRKQISLVPRSLVLRPHIWKVVQQMVHAVALQGVTAVQSSHSIDIVAPGVSKLNLVAAIKEQIDWKDSGSALCIGDKGQFPGNDFELLAEEFSLSVDEVSVDPRTCWNLAPSGYRGVQAAEYYLKSLKACPGGSVRLKL